MKSLFCTFVLLAALAASCGDASEAQRIVDRAIDAHGLERLRHATLEFDFRDKHYEILRDDGYFRFSRSYTDSTGSVYEVFSSDSLYRKRDGRTVPLTEREKLIVEEALNATQYLATLPLHLNDPAVRKQYAGSTTIEGEPYERVRVTFRQEGGGRDWEDQYVFWFHGNRNTMDYFAYNFDSSGGGSRFRRAINPRNAAGVLIQDYENYAAELPDTALLQYEHLVGTDSLRLVSRVIHKNVAIAPVR